ncbi:hypothetical protein FRB95_008719 [Tulasnella sp. JGI-2019a]|nr:hypothetical protein FRB95_008719 [Tulasnella sp. JGI-2019a]
MNWRERTSTPYIQIYVLDNPSRPCPSRDYTTATRCTALVDLALNTLLSPTSGQALLHNRHKVFNTGFQSPTILANLMDLAPFSSSSFLLSLFPGRYLSQYIPNDESTALTRGAQSLAPGIPF